MAFAKEGHYFSSSVAGKSFTVSVDMETGVNGVLFHFGGGASTTLSTVKLNGNDMTQRAISTAGGNNQAIAFYEWNNTGSPATVNLVVTCTGANIGRYSLVFYTDLGTYQANATDTADGDTLDVNTTSGDIVIGGGAFHDFGAYDGGDATLTGFDTRDTGAGTVATTDSAEYESDRFLEIAHLNGASGGSPEAFAIDYSAASPTMDAGAIVVVYTPSGGTSVSLDALSFTSTLNDVSISTNTNVALDALSFTSTLNDVTLTKDIPVGLDALTYSYTLNDIAISTNTNVALDALSYSHTLNDITVSLDVPVPMDALSYSHTLNDITVSLDVPVALDALSFAHTLQDISIAVGGDTAVPLDALSYSTTLQDITVSLDVPVALDALSFSSALQDITVTLDVPVSLDALSFTSALHDISIDAPIAVDLDALGYSLNLHDLTITVAGGEQSKGWYPVIYLDEDGNEVDLDAVAVAAEQAQEDASPSRQASVRRASAGVLKALRANTEPRAPDVRKLKDALARNEAALTALNAAIEQQREEEEMQIILLT